MHEETTDPAPAPRQPAARRALALLLTINLLNYVDRWVLSAVEPEIRQHFFPNDPYGVAAMTSTGSLATVFLISYMLMSPLFGWMTDRVSRWWMIGSSVIVGAACSAASGLAPTFLVLFLARVVVGVSEAAYGPAGPTILSDYFPAERRARILSLFYLAIPVGSAIGYIFASSMERVTGSWRAPFFAIAIPCALVGVLCFLMPDPRKKSVSGAKPKVRREELLALAKTPSYILNTLAMASATFAIGGLAFWVPGYLEFRGQDSSGRSIFGILTAIAGLLATISGGCLGDRLRNRIRGAYFVISGTGALLAFPAIAAMVFTPFPYAWACIFVAVFFLFLNTGPANAALVNVSPAPIRATAFAINIFLIHALGDAISPTLIGLIAGKTDLNIAFLAVSLSVAVGGILWLAAAPFLDRDSESATRPAA